MDIVLERLFQNKAEMRRLGAITIGVAAFVVEALDGVAEKHPRVLDVFADFGQVIQFQGRTVFLDDVHQGYIVEQQFVVLIDVELHRRKLKGLLNQVNVAFHSSVRGKK